MSQAASIAVAVRVRPPTSWEAERLPSVGGYDYGFTSYGDLSDSPRKPLLSKSLRPIVQVMDEKVLVFDPKDQDVCRSFEQRGFAPPGTKKYKDQRYSFDRVFNEDTRQVDVFEGTTKPLLTGLLDGFNATVFAYGATGCGKTHTISGTDTDPGIIYLTMAELFQQIQDKQEENIFEVSLSFLEIYNEEIRDLLTEPGSYAPRGGLAIREDKANKIIISNLTRQNPTNADEVKEMVLLGNSRRTQSPTHANETSSRSHAVIQINVSSAPRTASTTEERTSATLSIIDLAGSERASATKNMGERMIEGANINKSLLALGNCINALCESGGQTRHIPYRNSKLTRLLKFSLGGNCKTVMIVCVAPTSAHYEDTQNTLKYANRAKDIKTKVSRNFVNVDRHVAQYVEAINRLNEEVAQLKAKLSGKSGAEADVTKRRKSEAKAEVERSREDMLAKANQNRPVIVEGAAYEANLFSAKTRLSSIKSRLSQINTQAASGPLSPELRAESDLLRSMSAADESLTRSNSSASHRVQKANNADAMFNATLRAVSERRSDRLDEFGVDALRIDARCHRAEMDKAQAESREANLKTMMTQQADLIMNLVGMLARCTVMMSGGSDALQKAVEDVAGPLDVAVRSIAESMGRVASGNEEEFTKLFGQTVSFTPTDGSSLLNYTSQPLKPRFSTSAPIQKSRPRRSSLAGQHSPARVRQFKSPRKPTAMRQSLSKPGLLVARPEYVPAPPSRKLAVEKKSLRWKDEAGEGSLDDRSLATATSASAIAAAGKKAGADSETEWEDEKTEDSVNLSLSNVSLSLTSLASSYSASSSAPLPALNLAPPARRSRSSRLDPGFLKAKQPKLSSLAEDEESAVFGAPERAPLGERANQPSPTYNAPPALPGSRAKRRAEQDTSSASSEDMPMARPTVPGSATKSRRRSNIGPMRSEKSNRRRSSLIPKISPQHQSTSSSIYGPARRIIAPLDVESSMRRSPAKKMRRVSVSRLSVGGIAARAPMRPRPSVQRALSASTMIFPTDPNMSIDPNASARGKPAWR